MILLLLYNISDGCAQAQLICRAYECDNRFGAERKRERERERRRRKRPPKRQQTRFVLRAGGRRYFPIVTQARRTRNRSYLCSYPHWRMQKIKKDLWQPDNGPVLINAIFIFAPVTSVSVGTFENPCAVRLVCCEYIIYISIFYYVSFTYVWTWLWLILNIIIIVIINMIYYYYYLMKIAILMCRHMVRGGSSLGWFRKCGWW